MAVPFIRRVVDHNSTLSVDDVLLLLDQDAFSETFVPRSKVLQYLTTEPQLPEASEPIVDPDPYALVHGNVLGRLRRIAHSSVQCVVTSSPYWGMRIYKDSVTVTWADGEECVYGHEQTPDGFIRHTIQILHELGSVLTGNGSIWWNLGDTYNTRTQIRSNAAETLRAMQGKDTRSWGDYECRRYSAGHVYLKDGEQAMIPSQVAERASRIGYHVKSMISWAKISSTPEPQNSRVSRAVEYVLHLSKTRTPKFDKSGYLTTKAALGGRNHVESEKLSDVWVMQTSSGRGGHGAQFPTALPGRCIVLSTDPGDVVLDPFVGSGSSGVAALKLKRRFIGVDVSQTYLKTAEKVLNSIPDEALDEVPTVESAPSEDPTEEPLMLPMTDIA
ncbi:DNA-methyltransferase [Saccharothrix lopnurensis]|uniref:Methyltransferase n=1 Tax=Saccharothrix lopnurensis TaxID=1670621 RepID=A0ABW1NXW2_9PSEU